MDQQSYTSVFVVYPFMKNHARLSILLQKDGIFLIKFNLISKYLFHISDHTHVIRERKELYSPKFPDSSCVRKEPVDTDILTTSRIDERKIMHLIRITVDLLRE